MPISCLRSVNEVIPIVGDLADTENTLRDILSYSSRWDVIVTCTEPGKTDKVAEAEHWNALFKLVVGLTETSNQVASASPEFRRPYVLWSSGCKDYGTTRFLGDPDLRPHSETSSLDAPAPIRGRTDAALKALELAQNSRSGGSPGFDVAIVRATPIYGYSASYFGAAFEYASYAKNAKSSNESIADGQTLDFAADAETILHSLHVDDCADAYVALATTALLDNVNGKGNANVAEGVFNVSGRRYETLREVGMALAAEYGFLGGARFGLSLDEISGPINDLTGQLVFGWSQWVASDKIRAVTGWTDKRPLFSENLRVYRLAYEAAKVQGNDNVDSISRRMAGDWSERK
ncbi:uncharacterized protein ColSpa_07738 [Colletotrichum spaethianum]|uniref:NAD-dependent epimerase/dehydratase domain-containing protein n=1 Tax=Colletotrichum spaethianum TaxID=700344 RepID=A0AA37P8E7_9PEZI|nr:uncharacterized protein ColSpa_07738 [Colletotrichum spaethianum]GKT47557.1 hypothetical protein ColSpa_07738 [Colletotrichum spaethianum]